jgi:hypothetical protein
MLLKRQVGIPSELLCQIIKQFRVASSTLVVTSCFFLVTLIPKPSHMTVVCLGNATRAYPTAIASILDSPSYSNFINS